MNTSNERPTGQHAPAGQQGNAGASARQDSRSTGSSEELKEQASHLAEDAKRQGKAQADHYREVAADKVGQVADRIKAAAGELDEGATSSLSSHITGLADSMGRLSSDLREKSGDEILRDVNRLARQNPGMFVAGGLAVGFGLARLMKASASASQHGGGSESRSEPGGTGTSHRASPGSARAQDTCDQGVTRSQGAGAAATPSASASASPARDTLSTSGPGSAHDAQGSGGQDNSRSKLQ